MKTVLICAIIYVLGFFVTFGYRFNREILVTSEEGAVVEAVVKAGIWPGYWTAKLSVNLWKGHTP